MRRVIVIVILLSAVVHAFAQPKDTVPSFKYTGNDFSPATNQFVAKHELLSVFISSYLSKNYFYLHDSLCNTGVALVKFKIDATGHVVNLACSSTTPVAFSSALKKALLASEKYWIQKKKKVSGWIVQPVLYDYHTKCKAMKNDFYSLKGGCFQFDDDTKIANTDCLILDPIIMSSGVEESDLN